MLARRIDALDREINGPQVDPLRKPIRARLHDLEDVQLAAKAVEAAVALKDQVDEAKSARRDRRLAISVSVLAIGFQALLLYFR